MNYLENPEKRADLANVVAYPDVSCLIPYLTNANFSLTFRGKKLLSQETTREAILSLKLTDVIGYDQATSVVRGMC